MNVGGDSSTSMSADLGNLMAEWRENNPDNSGSDLDSSGGDDFKSSFFVSPKNTEFEKHFYGVYVPPELDSPSSEPLVFVDKNEALRVLKQNKKARFKAFVTENEASLFSQCGGGELSSCESPVSSRESVQYKGPKSQDLVKFRKSIEDDDIVAVRKFIDDNPRYLVGSGDTPAILQEGSRYNALHISARSNSANVCSYILYLISSVGFMRRLYGSCNSNLEERRDVLLDLYLNMPDKGSNETPLHFASKLGAVQIVKILTKFPQCDKCRKNKQGLTPIEIVCSRAPENMLQHKEEILALLDIQYYVPVLRADDNSIPPSIGEPFTPTNLPTPEKEPVTKTLEIKAVAGPMTESDARIFRKKWKTPTHSKTLQIVRPELSDPEKGLEKIGRKLAQQFKIQWKEYWPFLNSFVDIASTEGLKELENFLKREFRKNRFHSESCFLTPIRKKDRDGSRSMDSLISKMKSCSLESPTKEVLETPKKQCSPHELSEESDPFDLAIRKDSPLFYEAYQHAMHKSPKGRTSPVGTITMEKSCQVFASRIGVALIKGMKNNVLAEIRNFQVFLGGCKTDERFDGIDLHKAHYRLSVLINEKILSITDDRNTIVGNLCDMMSCELKHSFGDIKVSVDNLLQATVCICRCSVALLSCSAAPNKFVCTQDIESDILWSVAESCSCSLPTLKTARLRYIPRMLFQDDDNEVKTSTHANESTCSPAKICESEKQSKLVDEDTDFSDDEEFEEFYTAPSSPSSFDCPSSPASSEEDLLFPSEAGPDVFLAGNTPTKLDKAVLEAIENVPLSLKEYPHIVLWKYACQEFTKITPKERWSTPKQVSRTKPLYHRGSGDTLENLKAHNFFC